MFLTYVIIALFIGVLVGITAMLFWQQIQETYKRITKSWFFRHKAIHPYRVVNKDD